MMGLNPGPLLRALFHFVFYDSVGCVIGLGSGVFVPTGVKLKCDVFVFVVCVPIVVEYKGGRPIEMFWRSNS